MPTINGDKHKSQKTQGGYWCPGCGTAGKTATHPEFLPDPISGTTGQGKFLLFSWLLERESCIEQDVL